MVAKPKGVSAVDSKVPETPTSPTSLKGIAVICHGQYYYKTETNKGVKPFTKTVRAPSLELFRETTQKYLGTDDNGKKMYADRSFINLRGQLKRRLLPLLLTKDFPDFARIRFVVIDEIQSLSGEELDLPINLRSKAQLAELIRREHIPVDVAEYLDIDDLRSDLLEYFEDADTFLKNKSSRDRKRQEEREFAEMNNLNEEDIPPVRKTIAPRTPAVKPPVQGISDL